MVLSGRGVGEPRFDWKEVPLFARIYIYFPSWRRWALGITSGFSGSSSHNNSCATSFEPVVAKRICRKSFHFPEIVTPGSYKSRSKKRAWEEPCVEGKTRG